MEASEPDVVGVILRSHGLRATAPRRLILDVLRTTGEHHLSADELADAVHRLNPEVHPSTVYRTLESLKELGVVDHVHVTGVAYWHLTGRRHLHLVCDGCGVVLEARADLLADFSRSVLREHGFEVDGHHLSIAGRCRACRAANP